MATSVELLRPGMQSLPELVDAIEYEHSEILNNVRRGLEHAIVCGDLLGRAQRKVQLTENWTTWVDGTLSFNHRQAWKYMHLAEHKDKVLNYASKRSFTIDGALKFLADKRGMSDEGEEAPHVHGTLGTGENEWWTPKEHIELARTVLGEIDLDPASSDGAQERVQATKHFTDDGLTQPWAGRVWLNPPYSRELCKLFVKKLIQEFEDGNVIEAIMLTHNYTDTGWGQGALKSAIAACFPAGRIKFENPDNGPANPTQGQIFWYFGDDPEHFSESFSKIGVTWIKKPVTVLDNGGEPG